MANQVFKIIAICGLKRCGKDSIADHLNKTYGCKKISIAGPLKETCKMLFGLSDDVVNTDLKDEPIQYWFGLTPRQILQFYGTEMMQFKLQELMPGIGRQFWLKKLFKDIADSHTNRIVISDLRFVHEYQALISEYGRDNVCIIQVHRPCCESNDHHSSELEWRSIPPNEIVHNEGSLFDLYNQVDQFIHKYGIY